MPAIFRNVLAAVAGIGVCLALNGLLLRAMMSAMGTPAGFDPADPDTYGVLHARHYLSPLIAHAVPSLVGAAIAALIAATHKTSLALVVGGLHMVGGVVAAFMIPAPAWFLALDLLAAYLPMAWIGAVLVVRSRGA